MKKLLKEPFIFSIAAPRNSGKSYMVKTLLKSGMLKHFDKIHIFSPTLKFNDDYLEFFSNVKVYPHPNPTQEQLAEIWDEQEKRVDRVMMKKRSKQMASDILYKDAAKDVDIFKEIKADKKIPKILIILDDCIDSGVIDFRGVVDKFAERGRHLMITVFGISQRLNAISVSIRINSDYFAIFRPFSIAEVEKYLEQFVSKYHKRVLYDIIAEIFDRDFNFILLDNTKGTPLTERFKYGDVNDLINNKMKVIDFAAEAERRSSSKHVKKRERRSWSDDDDSAHPGSYENVIKRLKNKK